MDEVEEIMRLCVRALAAQMWAAPGIELHIRPACVLGLTDEPLADFNRLTLGFDPDAEQFLAWAVAQAKARGRPLAAVMSPQAAAVLAPVAARLGMTPAGTAPLMLLRAGTAVRPGRAVKVVRALGAELVGIAGDLAAAAFDVPRDVVARCIDAGVTETAGFETYVAWGEDGPVSAVTVTVTGNVAGISLMATAPAQQRRGVGRALLSAVIDDYRGRGIERFHLGATAAGLPLYTSLGFEVIAELSAWVGFDRS